MTSKILEFLPELLMTPEYEQYSKRDKHSPEVDWSRFQAII
jgi:hypothetical protein